VCLALFALAVPDRVGFGQSRRETTAGESRRVVACVARHVDYVRSSVQSAGTAAPQLLLTNPRNGTPTHNLTGLREGDLVQHVGRRVEIVGTLEPSRTTPVLSTVEGAAVVGSVNSERPPAAGITPDGAAAHEPADAVSTTVPAGKVAEPARVSDPAYLVPSLPSMNVSSFRGVAGGCPPPPDNAQSLARVTPTDQPGGLQPQVAAAVGDGREAIVVRGCLVRQTAGGTARTPQVGPSDSFALTQAVVVRPESPTARGAMPGSGPAVAGSGTVAGAVGTTGAAPVDAGMQSFRLVMSSNESRQLTQHVGDRVEVSGVLDADSIDPPPARAAESSRPAPPPAGRVQVAPMEVAHVSTPVRRITVSSFRPLGGACN
jgi:hypothetical protein